METAEIKGYEGLYSVTENGDVITHEKKVPMPRGNGFRLQKEKKLSLHENGRGYYHVILQKDGKRKTLVVHRLVAQAFISNPESKPEVNHKDGNKLNNQKDNLEWATSSENSLHSYKKGLQKVGFNRGNKHYNCKVSEEQAKIIWEHYDNGGNRPVKDFAAEYGVTAATISGIKNRTKRK